MELRATWNVTGAFWMNLGGNWNVVARILEEIRWNYPKARMICLSEGFEYITKT